MCGFLTWTTAEAGRRGPPAEALEKGLVRIAHRGPDDTHVEYGADHWFGFQRLSILDLSDRGRQPMFFEEGRYILTFNGEIYNYRELVKHLEGEEPVSTGDSEVLGRLLVRFGVEKALTLLRGMFAFAWWDRKNKELYAARDHFGIKPLYHAVPAPGAFALCSELKGLLGLPGVDREADPDALAQYFTWGAVQAPSVIVKGVKCLPPGHYLHWRDGRLRTEHYFSPSWSAGGTTFESHDECVRATREGLLESIHTHLISDVPVGVFLSGGLDSTIIAAGMKKLGVSELRSFSIGYEGETGVEDESPAAARTAAFLGASHVTEMVSAQRLEEFFDSYISFLDQPSGDALNTFLVSRLAAQHVKVTLSGLGADEWFGGYNHHRLAVLARRFGVRPSLARSYTGPFLNTIINLLPESMHSRPQAKALAYLSGGRGWDADEFYRSARTIIPSAARKKLLAARNGEAAGPAQTETEDHWLAALFDCETSGYLANTLLRDNDCMSMAHSLELRVPFVDRVVQTWSTRIAPEQKVNLGGGKLVLREAMSDLLPEWILNDRQKKTFTLPLMKWLREPRWDTRLCDVLGSSRCRERGWFNVNEVDLLLDRYRASRVEGRHGWLLSQRVWLCFVLESWAQSHIDGLS